MSKKSDYWAKHLAAIESSGLSTAQYAREHGLDPQAIYRWRYKLKDKLLNNTDNTAQNKLAKPDLKTITKQYVPAKRFVSLQVEQSTAISKAALTNDTACTINLGDNISLDFYCLPDPQWLAEVACVTRGIYVAR